MEIVYYYGGTGMKVASIDVNKRMPSKWLTIHNQVDSIAFCGGRQAGLGKSKRILPIPSRNHGFRVGVMWVTGVKKQRATYLERYGGDAVRIIIIIITMQLEIFVTRILYWKCSHVVRNGGELSSIPANWRWVAVVVG